MKDRKQILDSILKKYIDINKIGGIFTINGPDEDADTGNVHIDKYIMLINHTHPRGTANPALKI